MENGLFCRIRGVGKDTPFKIVQGSLVADVVVVVRTGLVWDS